MVDSMQIRIRTPTYQKLKDLRRHPRETFDDLIRKLFSIIKKLRAKLRKENT